MVGLLGVVDSVTGWWQGGMVTGVVGVVIVNDLQIGNSDD